MKALIIALSLLLIIGIFISVHSILMLNMAKNIGNACDTAANYAENEQWDGVYVKLEEIQKLWEEHRIWASLTISTNEIEQIEISLMQSRVFAQQHQKTDFLGEFAMFTLLIEHIPHQEGFHLAEIL